IKLPVPTLLLLAEGLFRAGARESAIEFLQRAQVAHAGDFWVNCKLGEYLMDFGSTAAPRMEEAARFFTAALVIRADSQTARVNRADVLTSTGAYREAEANSRLALEKKPDRAYVRIKLATALALAGQDAAARREADAAVTLRPKSAFVHE